MLRVLDYMLFSDYCGHMKKIYVSFKKYVRTPELLSCAKGVRGWRKIMKIIYENQVKALGACVEEFKGSDMLILFGDNAPEELRDYCYSVSVNPINGTITAGQTMKFGSSAYKITAVGSEAPVTLAGLGHCTVSFSGQDTVDLPGTIYVEKKPMPEIQVGTVIQIVM